MAGRRDGRLPGRRRVVSYAKARAEGLGHDGRRRHRRAQRSGWSIALVATGLDGLGRARHPGRRRCGCWPRPALSRWSSGCSTVRRQAARGGGADRDGAGRDHRRVADAGVSPRLDGASAGCRSRSPRRCSASLADQAWRAQRPLGAAAARQPAPRRPGRDRARAARARRASRHALLPALLAGGLPAARDCRREDVVRTRACEGEDRLCRRRSPSGRGVVLRAAAHGQLGPRRRLGQRRSMRRSPRSPSGSSPSRCTTGSSPTASRSGMEVLPLTGGGAPVRHAARAAARGRRWSAWSPTAT